MRKMSPKERERYLYLLDDTPKVLPILHSIYNYRRSGDIIKWLVKNNIKGERLSDFVKMTFENSIMSTVKYVLMKINRDKELKPIYAYKDYNL